MAPSKGSKNAIKIFYGPNVFFFPKNGQNTKNSAKPRLVVAGQAVSAAPFGGADSHSTREAGARPGDAESAAVADAAARRLKC
jgi:hypothetical protein